MLVLIEFFVLALLAVLPLIIHLLLISLELLFLLSETLHFHVIFEPSKGSSRKSNHDSILDSFSN